MERVVRWDMDMYRSADLTSIKAVNDTQWKRMQKAMADGVEVYLGEIAGKHSEVVETLGEGSIVVVTDVPEEVTVFKKLFPYGVGLDIMNAIEETTDYGESQDGESSPE